MSLKTDDFDFDLPKELIAARPAEPRDAARMLVVGPTLEDARVGDLAGYLRSGDLLVFNDTRVIPARLFGQRGAVRVEATLHRALGPDRWRCFARPGKRLRVGQRIDFAPDFWAEVAGKTESGEVDLLFPVGGSELMEALRRFGRMPLPPYIPREDGADRQDEEDYQTVFAARDGAVAAPTAGLHFTPALLRSLEEAGIERAAVTLHVGAGTFLPVKVEKIEDHRMHAEWGEIGAEVADKVNATRARGGRVVAVGTTSLRLLESAATPDGRLRPFCGETDIFITPGYRFRAVDVLLTNFHLPRSTLFMLVSALAGLERMKAAYRHAMDQNYRFYSYGDCCLLHREPQ